MNHVRRVLGILAATAFAAVLVWIQYRHWEGVALADDAFRFRLVDHHGRNVTEADFRGRVLLVYFGYTYCPDVCPTTLSMTAEALQILGAAAASVTPVMITIDPERDTPAVLADYMAAFGPSFVGLSGTAADIAAAARPMGAVYFKAGEGEHYTMDHSANLYVVAQDGRRRVTLPHGAPTAAVVEAVRRVMEAGGPPARQ